MTGQGATGCGLAAGKVGKILMTDGGLCDLARHISGVHAPRAMALSCAVPGAFGLRIPAAHGAWPLPTALAPA